MPSFCSDGHGFVDPHGFTATDGTDISTLQEHPHRGLAGLVVGLIKSQPHKYDTVQVNAKGTSKPWFNSVIFLEYSLSLQRARSFPCVLSLLELLFA
jgi:hypothetical protein